MRLGALVLLVCGCGRFGFGTGGDDTGQDAAPPPVDAGDVLATAIAHWTFDEGAGTLAADATGHNHSLTLVNNPAWVPGMFGTAIQSDGVAQYLVSPMFDFTQTQGVTLSFWLVHEYGTGSDLEVVLELGPDINQIKDGFGVFPDDTGDCGSPKMALSLQGDVGYSSSCYAEPTAFLWHHFVAVFDKSQPGAAQTKLVVDGVELSQQVVFGMDNTNAFGAQQLFLFARGGTQLFSKNVLDELILFDRALTPAEIAAL